MNFKTTELPELLRTIRECKGLSQAQFAKFVNLSNKQNVSSLENGSKPLTLKTLERVCKACNYSISVNVEFD